MAKIRPAALNAYVGKRKGNPKPKSFKPKVDKEEKRESMNDSLAKLCCGKC